MSKILTKSQRVKLSVGFAALISLVSIITIGVAGFYFTKAVVITAKLVTISDNNNFAQETYMPSSAASEIYQKGQELRRELYNSEDSFTRNFSTSRVMQIIFLVGPIVIIGLAISFIYQSLLILVYIYKEKFIKIERCERFLYKQTAKKRQVK